MSVEYGLFELEGDLGFDMEDEGLEEGLEEEQFLGGLLSTVAPMAINAIGSLLGGDSEGDGLFEDSTLGLFETSPGVSDMALMEFIAHEAATTDSEEEADAFIGALVPLAASVLPKVLPMAAKALPKVMPAIKKVLPSVVKGFSKVGKQLLKNPETKKLVKTLPTIARNTVASIAQKAAAGKPVTAQTALRTLAGQTANVLKSPQRTARVIKRHNKVYRVCCRPFTQAI